MGTRNKLKFRDLFGLLKDKASLSKAALLSKPKASTLHLTLLRATTHEASNPPHEKHICAFLSFGHSSRNTASTCIEALMDRLHNTRNSFVAFKCLIVVHSIIRRGSFILQDQLSVYPSVGGRNYLNLSSFNDDSCTETWNLAFWVRWYARVLETLLYTSRSLGFFFSSSLKKDDERVSSFLNRDLVKELDILVSLIEEICKAPEMLNVEAKQLVYEAMCMMEEDKSSAQKEIMDRVNELKERIGTLSFVDSVELVCVLKRYETCKEKLLLLFLNRVNSVGDRLWNMVAELKQKIGESKEYCDGRYGRRRIGVSESARFGHRVLLRIDDSVKFGSSRFALDRIPLPVLENIKSM